MIAATSTPSSHRTPQTTKIGHPRDPPALTSPVGWFSRLAPLARSHLDQRGTAPAQPAGGEVVSGLVSRLAPLAPQPASTVRRLSLDQRARGPAVGWFRGQLRSHLDQRGTAPAQPASGSPSVDRFRGQLRSHLNQRGTAPAQPAGGEAVRWTGFEARSARTSTSENGRRWLRCKWREAPEPRNQQVRRPAVAIADRQPTKISNRQGPCRRQPLFTTPEPAATKITSHDNPNAGAQTSGSSASALATSRAAPERRTRKLLRPTGQPARRRDDDRRPSVSGG